MGNDNCVAITGQVCFSLTGPRKGLSYILIISERN